MVLLSEIELSLDCGELDGPIWGEVPIEAIASEGALRGLGLRGGG